MALKWRCFSTNQVKITLVLPPIALKWRCFSTNQVKVTLVLPPIVLKWRCFSTRTVALVRFDQAFICLELPLS